jgi:hypothetical protein
MKDDKVSRRRFMRDGSLIAAGTIAGAMAARAPAMQQCDTSEILNYNPRMRYRRLGKTGLMISEVSLGGHWRAPWGTREDGWWWGKFANEQVPDNVAKNRTDVASRAMDWRGIRRG